MTENEKIFLELLNKYTSGTIYTGDLSMLMTMIASGNYDKLLESNIEAGIQSDSIDGAGLPPHRSQEILHNILSSEKKTTLSIKVK